MLRTQGGFCNRIRAIVSAVLWAEDLDRTLAIYWPVEVGHLPCRLDDLLVRSSIPHLCCVHDGYLSKAHAVQTMKEMESVLHLFGGSEEIRIESYSAFHPDATKERGLAVLRGLRFAPVLEEEAEKCWKEIGGSSSWTAIHFRGTDHRKCLAASPLEAFFKVLEVEDMESRQFYLATDEDCVKEAFAERFWKGHVTWSAFPQGRKTEDQQKAGVVEWLLLQKCSRILASAGSTFSEWAALRSGSKLIEVRGEEPEQNGH
jgi:hypothetical protein